MSSLEAVTRNKFRADLLRYFLEGKTVWDGFNAATPIWLKATEANRVKSGSQSVPLQRGRVWLSQQLIARQNRSVDPAVYDAFREVGSSILQNHSQKEYHWAKMTFHHPESPDINPFLSLLRDVQDKRSFSQWMEELNRWATFAPLTVCYDTIRLAQALYQRHHQTESYWVLDLGRKHLPHLFAGKSERVGYIREARDTATLSQPAGGRQREIYEAKRRLTGYRCVAV